MTSNHLFPSTTARSKVRRLNAAQSAAEWTSGAKLRRYDRSKLGLRGGTESTRSEQFATLSSLACALEPLACFEPAMRAQVQIQSLPSAAPECSAAAPLPNRSLVWTSTGCPRYARCSFSTPRGQPAPATQLKR